jgi:hypothetical protein
MILYDARLLRPEMAKARQRVGELEAQVHIEQATMWDKEDGLLTRVWDRMKKAEYQLADARDENTKLRASLVEEIAVYIESDSECLIPIVVDETRHDYGVRMLKAMAGEIREKFSYQAQQPV